MTQNSNKDSVARPVTLWRRALPDVTAVFALILISFVYFANPVLDGTVLTGHDHAAAVGAGVEMQDYRARHHGERTRWTNTLFSGMPTYQMSPSYPSTDRLTLLENIYKLGLPDYMVMLYVMLLGFYIMLRAFDFKAWMSALGAVLWAFSTYYIIIIFAGHIWKFYTLAFIPPTIGGMVLCYRRKYLWGLVVTAFFMALQILSNHPQMSYYFLPVTGLMSLAFLFGDGKLCPTQETSASQRVKSWLKGTAVFVAGCLIGVAINLSNLYHTWEYSKESMRGKSELTSATKDADEQTDSGIEFHSCRQHARANL